MNTLINDIIDKIEGKSPISQLGYLTEKFAGNISFSTSFGYEDQIITDMIFSHNFDIKVFTLDTGRMFAETYKTMNKTIDRYKKNIDVYFPDTAKVEKMMTEKGAFSFYLSIENRKECCNIRKVEPLKRALASTKCWVTGLRNSQSQARQNVNLLEYDENFNILKFNPLINWNMDDVLDYIRKKNVPYNSLHDKAFISIGCEPCTRAILPGEDLRAGRWWWENNSKKECGLHEK